MRFGLVQTKYAIISSLLKNKFTLASNMSSTLEYEEGSLVLMAKGGIHLTVEPLKWLLNM